MKRPENVVEPKLEKLLEDLLEIPGFHKVDILYSRRYRKQVREILDRIQVPMKIQGPQIVDKFGEKIRFLRRRRNSEDTSSDEDSDDADDDDITVLRKWFSRVAKCEKRLKAYEAKVGTCWHSLCCPCAPGEYFPPLKRILSPIVLERTKQEVAFDVDYVRSVDVSRLLGSFLVDQNGHRQSAGEACRGKHVLVCFISFPVLLEMEAFQFLITLCNELSSEKHDVQVVIVAKIFSLADTRRAFYHLFSAFPESCLAVPYPDKRLEDVARLLSRGTHSLPHCVAYGPDGRFLESFCAINYLSFPYGAEAFPFTKEKVREVLKKRAQLRTDRLENLLRPYEWSRPDDVVVYDLEKRTRPLSQVVKNKHVGLYLYSEGSLFPRLLNLCMHCNSKELEFEIVMLYLPFPYKNDPHTFAEMRVDVLAEHKVRGWWRLPFNNSVSLRFCDLTYNYDIGEDGLKFKEDNLIIVGPDGKILDMYGAQAIKKDYRFDAHPFTRAAVVENRMRRLRDVKLDSLVAGGSFFRGDDPNHAISARTLLKSKKKIIIYFGKPKRMKEHLGALVSQYKEMRRNGDEFEVVIVDFSGPRRAGVGGNKYGAIPWYICCCRRGTYLVKTLRELVKLGSLVGFGEDGRICSVKRLYTSIRVGFREDVPAGLCLEDTLRADLHHNFQFDQCRAI